VDPRRPIEIVDEGAARLVRLVGPVHAMGRRLEAGVWRVSYSRALLADLLAALGPYLIDELERELNPQYLRARIGRTLGRLGIPPTEAVLDFGCGKGSSSLVLAALGYGDVVGVDVDARSVELARRRAAEREVRARFETALPAGPFDLILCNAVLEHLTPEERASTVRELWARLRPGGHLVVQETPNRRFPIDRHTTGRALVPWLPLGLKLALARAADRTAAFRTGIHGVSPSDFDEWIPPGEREDRSKEADPELEELTATGRTRGRLERAAIGVFAAAVRGLSAVTGRPPAHFYPYLLVCFRKTGGETPSAHGPSARAGPDQRKSS
jgi:SAM-dependent methyltransferase